MSPGYQSIDISLSPLANDEANLEATVEGVSSDPQGQIPSTETPKLPQAEANYKDGPETLFSLYNEKTLEFDSKHIENWREDANSLVILSGLVSAAVSGFLAQSYISFQTNSQDVSAFYLSQIYQIQLSLNGTASIPTPAPPVPARAPVASHVLWFVSLAMSLACAVGATMAQEWIRRFQLLTQLWSSPHRRSAHIRASISRDRFLEMVPAFLKSFNLLLHSSIYLFLSGLVSMPLYFNDTLTSEILSVCGILSVVGYLFIAIGFVRIWSYFATLLMLHSRDFCSIRSPFFPFRRSRTITRHIERDASTPSRTSTLDADEMSWLLDSLTDEEEFERFFAGIPGFYKSKQVEDPAKVLQQVNTDTTPKAILAFMDRSISSDLPEETRQRRIKLSLEAMQTHPYLLRRSFHHALRACSTEPAIFKSVDFALLADQHTDDKDGNTRLLARWIIAIAINRLEDYQDKRWVGIIQRRLNWPEDLFHREQRDNIKLRNLVQLARDLISQPPPPRPDSDALSREVFMLLLSEVCNLNVGNAAPKLQDDLFDLCQELAQLPVPDQDPALPARRSEILSSLNAVRGSLNQVTESHSPPFPANTTNLAPQAQNTSSYSLYTVPHHPVTSADPGTSISVAQDSGDAE